MAECLGHVALAGLTVVAWLGLGSLLLGALPRVGDRVLDLLNRIACGAIGLALLTFAAGWAGLVHRAAYAAVFALLALVGLVAAVPFVRAARFPALRDWRGPDHALALVLLCAVLLGALATCAPVSSPDALLYHAADPARFAEAGRIFEIPWNSSSYEPFTVQLLVLGGMLLWGPVQGAFAAYLLALLALAAVVGAGGRLGGPRIALLAGAIFFVQPLTAWESTSVFVEPGLAAAVALAAWNLARFVRHGERQALAIAGLLAGGAAGMKYLGLIAALALVVTALLLARRSVGWRTALLFGAPAVLVAAPWYVKNAVLTGNPFYPHLLGGLNEAAAAELERTMRAFGHGRSPLDLVLLPFRFLTDGEAYDGGELVSPLFLAFAPLTLLAPRPRRPPAAVWAGLLVFLAGWFVTSQQARFLFPIMPVAALLAALGAQALCRRGAVGRVIAIAATTVALAGGLAATATYAAQFAPVVLGRESEERFLRDHASFHEGVEWLNQNLGPDDRVAVSFGALLYLEVPYVSFGTMGDLLPEQAGAEETAAFVERRRVTHFAVLARQEARRRQAEAVDGRLVARVPVRSVVSRTRGEYLPQTMLVYALEGNR